jgi:hypothetical protein
MSSWLGRPHLINQNDLSFVLPNLRLEKNTSEPNLLSPFAHMALQAQLARRIAPTVNAVREIGDLSPEQVSAILLEVDRFIQDLPPVFRIEGSDTSLDTEHPYFVFQRYQLHVVIYITMIDFLKPYLAGDPTTPRNERDAELRLTGVELSLKMLKVARLSFNHEFPINAKFHMIVFCIFDTATILCSALIHDINNALPYSDIIAAIESALDMLHQLSQITKIGLASYRFLLKLVRASPKLHRLVTNNKRPKLRSGTSAVETEREEIPPVPRTSTGELEHEISTAELDYASVSRIPTSDDLSFNLDEYLAQNPFEDPSELDIDGIEAIWDWENLNLEGYLL